MSDTSLPNAIIKIAPNLMGIYGRVTEIIFFCKNIDDSFINGIFQGTISVAAFNVAVGRILS